MSRRALYSWLGLIIKPNCPVYVRLMRALPYHPSVSICCVGFLSYTWLDLKLEGLSRFSKLCFFYKEPI
jgi:hypothetical protein